MTILLKATNGRQLRLRDGQVARIGRTEWSDLSFPGDEGMADVHAEIRCEPAGTRLRDLTGGDPGVTVNGAPADDVALANGDEIRLGSTSLRVTLVDPPTGSTSTAAADAARPSDATSFAQLPLSDEGRGVLASGGDGPPSIRLEEAGLLEDALRVLAFQLPRPVSVSWGVTTVRGVDGFPPNAEDAAALAAAEAWAAEPSEEHRRAAKTAADAGETRGPGAWLALAAFWSGGSIAPEDAPQPVAPDVSLLSTAVTGAIVMATASGDAPATTAARRAALAAGRTRLESGDTP